MYTITHWVNNTMVTTKMHICCITHALDEAEKMLGKGTIIHIDYTK